MLEPLLWLTPIAKDFLRCVSKVLRGNVPCPAKELADLLSKTEDGEGLLAIESFRKAVAAEIAKMGGEVKDSAAPALVSALGKALQKEIDVIKKSASGVNAKQLLKKGGPMPSFSAALPLQPQKGQSQALSKDWIIWNGVANAHDDKLVSAPPDAVVAGRIALAACCPDGAMGDCALALDILDNIDAYIQWEMSLAGSKTPTNKIEVLSPFDSKTTIDVAMRRMLSTALPPEVALQVIAEANGSIAKVASALRTLAESMRAQSLIPMYAAPPAPKEPKAQKEPKENKGKSEKKGKGDEAKPSTDSSEKKGKNDQAKSTVAAPFCPSGPFGEMYVATACQELQWQLLSYYLSPGTALSLGDSSKTSSSQKTPSAEPIATAKPSGFAGLWGGRSPPGHTTFSWTTNGRSAGNSFQELWSTGTGVLPPGHTRYSWTSGTR